jgi:3-deoxy-D-manno-octulosonate 8-phosphate phosphatase (KDO 8-P phosphatase)
VLFARRIHLIDKNVARQIKAIVTDVDGVLTDGTFWWDANELELKRFCFADITGIPLAQKAGIRIALMSGESSVSGMAIVERYAKKLNIEDVYKGCHDKAKAVTEFAEKHKIALSEICFVGDDINDLPAMKRAGLSVAPLDSHKSVLKSADFITASAGGHGVIREVVDILLEIRSKDRKTVK